MNEKNPQSQKSEAATLGSGPTPPEIASAAADLISQMADEFCRWPQT